MHTETDGEDAATVDVGDRAGVDRDDDAAVAGTDGVAIADGGEVTAASDGDEDGADSGPDGDAVAPDGHSGLGRRILLSVGAIVIVISGGLGWFVGSNGQLTEAAVLGTGFAVPVTPGALALYGIVVSTAILGGLFALVELASRLEGDGRAE